MNGDVLIRCENVSKIFCRDLKRSLWYGIRDISTDLFFSKKNLPESSKDIELRDGEFWANKDISFEVKRGECLGLIGRNGAGKTTLLKMLNGLIKPDTGIVEVSGRVGALIALGAGFNPVLTGRENIFVNGNILGLSRRQILEKFDEIVEFSELTDFVDSPIKSYSSGMKVRLGFAIAALLLKPDVLLLDEVLAVGDIGFRLKCLNAVRSMQSQAAVIFVSHNDTNIARICTRVVALDRGQKWFDETNVGMGLLRFEQKFDANVDVFGDETISVRGCEIRSIDNLTEMDIRIYAPNPLNSIVPRVSAFRIGQQPALQVDCSGVEYLDSGISRLKIRFETPPLRSGKYFIGLIFNHAKDDRVIARCRGQYTWNVETSKNFEFAVNVVDGSCCLTDVD